MTPVFRIPHLLHAGIGLVCAAFLAISLPARGVPVYAGVRLDIDGFGVSGATVTSVDSLPIPVLPATSAVNRAELSGFGSAPPKSDATDPLQARSGPGEFPGENSFVLLPAPESQFARSDSRIIPGANKDDPPVSARLVAEDRRTSSGTAASRAEIDYLFLVTQDTDGPVKFSFSAATRLEALAGALDDEAVAEVGVVLTLSEIANHELKKLLTWTPCGDVLKCFDLAGAGAVSDVRDPFSLNTSLSCLGDPAPCTKSYLPDPAGLRKDFSLAYDLGKGSTYAVSAKFFVSASVVPEPATIALCALALAWLGIGRWRRTAA